MTYFYLFADGGVIEHNPSPKGGMWAWRLCKSDEPIGTNKIDNVVKDVINCNSFLVVPTVGNISNNITEMMAILNGLMACDPSWNLTVLSDSQIALKRIFSNWKWKHVPQQIHDMYDFQEERFGGEERMKSIPFMLLQGHPTNEELKKGVGDRGYPVSKHNVWCDKQCGLESEKYLKKLSQQIQFLVQEDIQND